MPPRGPHRLPPKKASPDPKKYGRGVAHLLEFYPQKDGDPYYRNVEDPIEFMLLVMRDERQPLPFRYDAAQAVAPYMRGKIAPRPYIPTTEEREALEGSGGVVIELITGVPHRG